MELVVSAEDDAEVRRISLTNSSRTRESGDELREVVSPGADAAHPAFSNLFIETEFFAAEKLKAIASAVRRADLGRSRRGGRR